MPTPRPGSAVDPDAAVRAALVVDLKERRERGWVLPPEAPRVPLAPGWKPQKAAPRAWVEGGEKLKPKGHRDRKRTRRYIEACQGGKWHLHLSRFDKLTGLIGKDVFVRYRCKSWRHAGECRRYVASQNFARLNEALRPYAPAEVSFLVLTFDRERGANGRRPWRDRWAAFDELVNCWRSLAKWLRRNYGVQGYCSTVEAHRDGWPHLNVVLVSNGMGLRLGLDQEQVRRELVAAAVRCGFGPSVFVERARSMEQVAGYAVKVAGNVENPGKASGPDVVGEVVKLTQLPEDAPNHFRRLRSSRGFLPSPRSASAEDDTSEHEWCGALVRKALPVVEETELAALARGFDQMAEDLSASEAERLCLANGPEPSGLLQDDPLNVERDSTVGAQQGVLFHIEHLRQRLHDPFGRAAAGDELSRLQEAEIGAANAAFLCDSADAEAPLLSPATDDSADGGQAFTPRIVHFSPA